MTARETVDQRVKCGAALLDKKYPGWAKNINCDELRIESCDKCVIGQLYDWFHVGASALNLNGDGKDMGFALYSRAIDGPSEANELRAAWLTEIQSRRVALAAEVSP